MPSVSESFLVIDVSSAHRDRLCWSLALPAGLPAGDSPRDEQASGLQLFEDGIPLGPAHTLHSVIREQGGGRFSHWGHNLYFSTSDDSDPRVNGRVYAIAGAGIAVSGSAETTADAAKVAAGYELSVAEAYLELLRERGIDPAGLEILEIGPGDNLGAQLLLACAGARVTVADRFMTKWRPEHADVYRVLAQCREGDTALIHRVLDQCGFENVIRMVAEPAEAMPSIADGSIGVVLSNAVLEHVMDLSRVAAELKRISAPGAWHFHQVDFRDHHCLTRPLEHLLMMPDRFRASQERNRWERGCQTRLSQMCETFAAAGFNSIVTEINDVADPDYLSDILPRLRASASPYADWPADDLAIIGARLILQA